ncbi:hypothetical protein Y1Q_0013455 [Alligator mississippiensis]|uniref:Uncharacterized protein n=1 Tax=Alligator mississippiensis TaxID=8496 RepID=A0A151MSC7_ALLMI|nr:hypothetical protein Y1Q_0013455 [Alligator mississippiensis]
MSSQVKGLQIASSNIPPNPELSRGPAAAYQGRCTSHYQRCGVKDGGPNSWHPPHALPPTAGLDPAPGPGHHSGGAAGGLVGLVH